MLRFRRIKESQGWVSVNESYAMSIELGASLRVDTRYFRYRVMRITGDWTVPAKIVNEKPTPPLSGPVEVRFVDEDNDDNEGLLIVSAIPASVCADLEAQTSATK